VLNDNISILEVVKAVNDAKRYKACGFDCIPSDVLKNDCSIMYMHSLFNICFTNGTIPTVWGKGIITPIPKSSTNDPRDPSKYRGIMLTCSMYKIYVSVINNRVSEWCESNDKLANEQYGFRKKRSTIDHVLNITNIIQTRKCLKLPTFCAFIDFKKAYDCINRSILWNKLYNLGICGKIMNAVKSLYSDVSACVQINGFKTGWFNVNSGLRQGCVLSPLLFNVFINDLANTMKSLNKGITVDNEKLCIFMYADDIVLLADNENDLQCMLDVLYNWCQDNDMFLNLCKSNIVHFRVPSQQLTVYDFKYGNCKINVVNSYTYLGVLLTEHLDYKQTAKVVAQSASRALGLLIAKFKIIGGMSYEVFTKLYHTLVNSVIAYSAPVWGFKSYTCIINAVQNRAMRFFIGTGKFTPVAALSGDMGWVPTCVGQWKVVCGYWHRCCQWAVSDLRSKIFRWALHNAKYKKCKNWCHYVDECLTKINANNNVKCKKVFVSNIVENLNDQHCTTWSKNIVNETGKLRTYKLFKHHYGAEPYCTRPIPRRHRSALGKFRCGVAPLRVETGRYTGIPVDLRHCVLCNNGSIEDEIHVFIECKAYTNIRNVLFSEANNMIDNFYNMSAIEKFTILFSEKCFTEILAKTSYQILKERNKNFYC
jgi:hypothetical protein